ncbi:MAG: hypothetical protein WBL40_13105, partial [Terrimicrobiaceae bacterium]
TVGGDGGAPKIHGALAAARQGPRANGYQLRIIEQEINPAEGRVLEAGELDEVIRRPWRACRPLFSPSREIGEPNAGDPLGQTGHLRHCGGPPGGYLHLPERSEPTLPQPLQPKPGPFRHRI